MLNVEALKEVFIALGGKVANWTAKTNDEAISQVASVTSGAVLPKVTSSNNGQVLTVDGGKWKAKEPSGGGVTVFHIWEDDGAWTTDATFAEIAQLVKEEKPIQAIIGGGSMRPIPLVNYTMVNNNVNLLQFCLVIGGVIETTGVITTTKVDFSADSLSVSEIYMTATIVS